MKSPQVASKFTAGLFIVITLWAFWNLQDSGPEGTLRRFVGYAAEGNWPAVNRILAINDQQISTLGPAEQLVLGQARRIGSGPYRVVPVRRQPRLAVVTVQNEDSNGYYSTTWVLTRPSLSWTVDLRLTILARIGPGTNRAQEPPAPHSGLMDRS